MNHTTACYVINHGCIVLHWNTIERPKSIKAIVFSSPPKTSFSQNISLKEHYTWDPNKFLLYPHIFWTPKHFLPQKNAATQAHLPRKFVSRRLFAARVLERNAPISSKKPIRQPHPPAQIYVRVETAQKAEFPVARYLLLEFILACKRNKEVIIWYRSRESMRDRPS